MMLRTVGRMRVKAGFNGLNWSKREQIGDKNWVKVPSCCHRTLLSNDAMIRVPFSYSSHVF